MSCSPPHPSTPTDDSRCTTFGYPFVGYCPLMGSSRVAVVGAGFGGVAVAAALKRAGHHDVVVLEKADDVGGVWRENTYPGCGCDIPAPLYSFSFAQNPDWSRRYPPYDEIAAYLRKVVADEGLGPHLRLGTAVHA